MCGRSSLCEEPEDLLVSYGLSPKLEAFVPRFNIAPSQLQWAILESEAGGLEVRTLRWGLLPYWAKGSAMASRMINARSETLAWKPSFREALQRRRCLIIADGYYEWIKTINGRTPFRFQMKNRKAFVFAGLWDRWMGDGAALDSCTIVTTNAAPATAHIHPRMPVILPFADSTQWMKSKAPEGERLSLLRPYSGNDLEIFEVSRAVNSPANDTPECVRPVAGLISLFAPACRYSTELRQHRVFDEKAGFAWQATH